MIQTPTINEIAFTRFVAFVRERELIRLRREAGAPPPWTEDPILGRYRFCNVRREHDRTTRWIAQHWREPHADDPLLWFAMLVARVFNWIPTLEAMGYPVPWQAAHLTAARIASLRGDRVFSAAYMMPTNGRLCPAIDHWERVLEDAWRVSDSIPIAQDHALRDLFGALEQLNGLGPFLAAQVVADVKQAGLWRVAEDWKTFFALGPGSLRGAERIGAEPYGAATLAAVILPLRARLNLQLSEFPLDICAQDVQNCLCEWDKYERTRLGEGRPRRRYHPIAQRNLL